MFGEATGGMLARILENRFEAATLAALRNTLLPKLLSGEIRLEEAASATGDDGLMDHLRRLVDNPHFDPHQAR